MLADREIWEAHITSVLWKNEQECNKSLRVAKAQGELEAIFSRDTCNQHDIEEVYQSLMSVQSEIAYMQGLEDGANMIHMLLTKGVTSKFLEAFNDICSDISEFDSMKANAKRAWLNAKNSV